MCKEQFAKKYYLCTANPIDGYEKDFIHPACGSCTHWLQRTKQQNTNDKSQMFGSLLLSCR